MVKPVSVQYRKCRQVVGAPDTIRTCALCLRRATLYPAELRVRCGSFSRLAVRRQRPCLGWLGVRARPPKAKVTRSNRVGCARKAGAERAGIVAGQNFEPEQVWR